MPIDNAGNSLGTARGLNITPTTQIFQDHISSLDINDYYRFTLSSRSSFNLLLNRSKADVNVELLNSSGQVVQSSNDIGKRSQSISKVLEAGTYYIRDYQGNPNANTYYRMRVSANPLSSISNLSFSNKEGDSGTFKIKLNQAPTSDVTVNFNAGSFLSIDADNDVSNGTQNTITFTSTNWNTPQTVRFIAEKDGSSDNRTSGNTIGYTLSVSDGPVDTYTYDLGTIVNTYAPDKERYNIDLDFRNDYLGFWTPERRKIAQDAADDWAGLIKNELLGSQYKATIPQVNADSGQAFRFTTNQYVDDIVVFVGATPGSATNRGAGTTFSGNTVEDQLPRLASVAINASLNWSDAQLCSAIGHEIGHALGLLGYTVDGEKSLSQDKRYFIGDASKKANGGNNIPMADSGSPDKNSGHPDDSVDSIMSYGYINRVSASSPTAFARPTKLDKAFLADSGYLVKGVNYWK